MNINKMSQAYLKGESDGFNVGVENNTYSDDQDRLNYRAGYDSGVARYCYETYDEND
jgi:hypothetical protein